MPENGRRQRRKISRRRTARYKRPRGQLARGSGGECFRLDQGYQCGYQSRRDTGPFGGPYWRRARQRWPVALIRMTFPAPGVRPITRSAAPRLLAGLLTAWIGAWLDGRAASDDLLTSTQGSNEPHTVRGLPDESGPVPLARALSLLRRCAPADVSLLLPVPGDPDGLAGAALTAALAAGEAVAVQPLDAQLPGWLLIPAIEIRGSALEPLVNVEWQLSPLAGRLPTGITSPTRLREAEHALSESVSAAVTVIAEIGQVGQLSPEIVAAITDLRKRSGLKLPLPPGSPADAIRVLTTAQRLEVVVSLAAAEQPLSAAADARRAAALREVARAVRDAYRLAFAACAAGDDRR